MSYRKLIALTVFGAAVFLQGCEDDDEEPDIRCNADHVIIDSENDDALEFTTDDLLSVINTAAGTSGEDDFDSGADACRSCLLEELNAYDSADTDFTYAEADDVDTCWNVNAAMKACGAAAADLKECTGTPCLEDTVVAEGLVTAGKFVAELSDCYLCMGESEETTEQDQFEDCGGTITLADVNTGCADLEVPSGATVDTAANLLTTINALTDAADVPADVPECDACVAYFTEDLTDCDKVEAQFKTCGGSFHSDLDGTVCS